MKEETVWVENFFWGGKHIVTVKSQQSLLSRVATFILKRISDTPLALLKKGEVTSENLQKGSL